MDRLLGDLARKIFLTGGSGFIGSHVVDMLIPQGYSVTVYDNLSNGRREFIEHQLGRPNFRFVEADILDTSAWPPRWKGTTSSGTWRPTPTSSAAPSSRGATSATA